MRPTVQTGLGEPAQLSCCRQSDGAQCGKTLETAFHAYAAPALPRARKKAASENPAIAAPTLMARAVNAMLPKSGD